MHCNNAEVRIKSLTITNRNQPANQIRMLQSNFASLGRTIGSLFIPLLQTVLPYINAIVIAIQRMFAWIGKLLGIKLSNFVSSTGGISVDTSNIADNMDNASGAIDNANTSAKKLEKTLSVLSFDELNQLNDNSDSSSTSNPSSGSGGGASHLPALDAALDDALSAYQKAWEDAYKKMSNRANEMADAIVNAFKKKDWEGLGKTMANGINKGMKKLYDFINWNNVGPKITKFTDAFTRTFNSLVDNIDWDLMGRTVGAGINTIVNTANQLLEGTNWKNLGKKFAEGIMGLTREVDWTNLGNLIGNNFVKSWDIFYGFVSNLKYDEIGIDIGNALNGVFEKIDFSEIASALTTGINGAFTALANFTETFNWEEFTKNLGNGISKFISDMDWKENGQALGNFLSHLATALSDALTPETFHELGANIGTFLGQLPWGQLLATAARLLIGGFAEAMSGLWESGLTGKITAGLTTAFVAVKIADITGIGTLVGKLIGKIGDKIMAKESAELIAERLASILGNGTSTATEVLDGLGEAAGGSASKFGTLAQKISPLVGEAGLIALVTVGALEGISALAGFIEKIQGGNGILSEAGGYLHDYAGELEASNTITRKQAENLWKMIEADEQAGKTNSEMYDGFSKKLEEYGISTDKAKSALERYQSQGSVTNEFIDTMTDKIKGLGDGFSTSSGTIDASSLTTKEAIKGIKTTLDNLSNSESDYAGTYRGILMAFDDTAGSAANAQGAFDIVYNSLKDAGVPLDEMNKALAEIFPNAVQAAKESASKQTSEIRWNTTRDFNDAASAVTSATGKMKTTAMSDLEAIHAQAETSASGVSTATVTQWGNSATEVDKNLDQMKQHANIKLGEMTTTVESQFGSQFNIMVNKWTWASQRIDQIIDGMDSNISQKIPNMSKYFDKLASNISNSLKGLHDIGTKAATSLYNGMKLVSMPKLDYHITSWNTHNLGNGQTSSTPVYSPYWYAKGGLFQSASIIGVGEAGNEAVLPLENQRVMSSIADSIMSNYKGDNIGLTKQELAEAVERGVVTALMNNGGLGGSSPEYIMNSIKVNERELARIVTKAQNNTDYRMNPSPAY